MGENKISVEDLLKDTKCNFNDSFSLLMLFFARNSKHLKQEKIDLEKYVYNEDVYKKLGWLEKCPENKKVDQPYDVINSFWTIFTYSLVNYSETKQDNYCKFWKSLGKNWNKEVFKFNENGFLEYAYNKGMTNIGKDKYGAKVIDKKNVQYKVLEKFFSEYEGAEKIKELAKLTHTVANFMPCPPQPYNTLKAFSAKVYDFLPLMIDLIQECCDNNTNATYTDEGEEKVVELAILQEWKTWFIKNRTSYCLEDYYIIKDDKIIGIPMFDIDVDGRNEKELNFPQCNQGEEKPKQSLSYPVPMTENEVKQCLNEMVKRINLRAYRLYFKATEEKQ